MKALQLFGPRLRPARSSFRPRRRGEVQGGRAIASTPRPVGFRCRRSPRDAPGHGRRSCRQVAAVWPGVSHFRPDRVVMYCADSAALPRMRDGRETLLERRRHPRFHLAQLRSELSTARAARRPCAGGRVSRASGLRASASGPCAHALRQRKLRRGSILCTRRFGLGTRRSDGQANRAHVYATVGDTRSREAKALGAATSSTTVPSASRAKCGG